MRPLVGAIRWDAWHGAQGIPGRAVQSALGPLQWHHRLPFFAEALGDDDVRVDGTAPDVMDREIGYASHGGLDYWAFVAYPPDDPMSIGLRSYLSSRIRDRIRFCLIAECSRWADPGYVTRLAELASEPVHLAADGNRPVVFLGFIDERKVCARWGDAAGFRRVVDGYRAQVEARGRATPYIVIMDFSPEQGHRWMDSLGADAISSYAVPHRGDGCQPYARLAEQAEEFWTQCRDTGAQVAPTVMSGWDRRPRIARPMPWETWQKPGVGMERYCEAPSPSELAGHMARALDWIRTNEASARAGLVITYAWNENDEGGWLVPTLSEGPARLDALRSVLRPGAGRSAGPGPAGGLDHSVFEGGRTRT